MKVLTNEGSSVDKDTIPCRCCGKPCELKGAGRRDNEVTWFGSYQNAELVAIICRECWQKGERWQHAV